MSGNILNKLLRLSKNTLSYLSTSNSILVIILVILNTLNIFYNYKNNWVLFISIILLVIYLLLLQASFQEKMVFIFIYLVFSITTLFGESIVISTTGGKALRYGVTSFNTNVPIWLFSAYLNMVLVILFLEKIGNFIFLNIIHTVKT